MESIYSNVIIKILGSKESAIDNATLFDVEVATPYSKWFLAKKFDDFNQLNVNLQRYFHSLPEFPEESLVSMALSYFTNDKDDKVESLQEYLQGLVIRKDVLASDFLIEFLQLNHNSPQMITNNPILLGDFTIDKDEDFPNKGIRDFFFDEEQGTFIILTGDMNAVSRFNSYLVNTKLPWEDNTVPTLLQVGSVECWTLFGNNASHNYKKVWSKIYSSQAICLEYSKSKQRLYIGLDNGQVDQLKVSSRDKYSKVEQVRTLQVHEERVTGVYLDSLSSVMYSIGADGALNCCEMVNCFKIMSIPHDVQLSSILADQTNKRIFIGADEGQIYLYDISARAFPKLLISIYTPEEGPIKTLALDLQKNYLFSAGFENGLIAVFDLDKPGREKYAKQIACFQGKQNPRRLAWASNRMEVLVGMQDGSVCFWNSLSGEPVYLLCAHQDQITKMFYNPLNQVLITASKGQQIRFWQIPAHWRDIKQVQMEQDKIEERRKVDNAMKIKDKVRRIAEDSDDDDLVLWYKTPEVSDDESDEYIL